MPWDGNQAEKDNRTPMNITPPKDEDTLKYTHDSNSTSAGSVTLHGTLSRAALLVIDWQLFFTSASSPAFLPQTTVAQSRVSQLVAAFAEVERPIVATRHAHPPGKGGAFRRFYGRVISEADPLARLESFLADHPAVRVISKYRYSAFVGSSMAHDLAEQGVTTVVITGLQTDKCIMATAFTAFDEGFDVIVATDACVARSKERHCNALALLERSCATALPTQTLLDTLLQEKVRDNAGIGYRDRLYNR